MEVRHLVRLRTDSSIASLPRPAGFQPGLQLQLTSKMLVRLDKLEAYLERDRALPLSRNNKISRTRHGPKTEESRWCDMKKLKLLSLVGITSIALANAGWAAGHGGGGGGGGHGGGGFHGGDFRGGHFHHGFSNNVFIGDFGFPGWWGWGYPYGYYGGYGYGDYPYDYYGYPNSPYGYYGGRGYGYRYGNRPYLHRHASQSGRAVHRQQQSRRHVSR